MNSINPYQQPSTDFLAQNANQQATAATTATSDTNNNAQTTPAQTSQSSVYISERSKQLFEVNNRFFHNKKIAFDDIPQYINELHTKGLLSSDQYQHLSSKINAKNDTGNQPQGELARFVTNLADALSAESPEHILLKPLQQTADLFASLEQGKQLDAKALKEAQLGFNQFFNTDEFKQLPTQAQQGLEKITQMLAVVAKTTQSPIDKTSAYKDIAKLF